MIITDQIADYFKGRQMNRLSIKNLIIILIVISAAFITVDLKAETAFHRDPEKSLFGKKRKVKNRKVREPRSVTRKKHDAEKKQLKIKQDYFNYVDKSKKRVYQIQSPAVQARMKQNEKDIRDREKSNKKKKDSATRRGSRKYGK